MDIRHRSPGRLFAPVALVVFAIALLVILSSAGGSDHSSSSSAPTKAEQRDLQLRQQQQRPSRRGVATTRRPVQSVYVVKTGDTLAGIAIRTGVPVTRLQELNPTLDPQALLSGQRIKLR
jgi:LysM repeat protein